MTFSLVRNLFIIIFTAVCFLFIIKSNIVNKRKWIVTSFLMSIVLVGLSYIGPIENAFITFPTAESAYNYSKEGSVKYIIEGEESDLAIGKKENDKAYANILAIIPKTNDGWKLSTLGDLKRVTSSSLRGVSIDVYQYKNSDDYYIMVYCFNGSELDIKDNRNSNFGCYESYNKDIKNYYSYIHCFDEEYVITVDGNPISFDNIKK